MYLLRKILILILLFSSVDAYYTQTLKAQNPEIDNLETSLINHALQDTVRVNLLNHTASRLLRIDNTKALKYIEESNTIANKLNFAKGQAQSLKLNGIYYYFTSDYPSALKYYKKALFIFKQINNQIGISSCLNNIGIIYKKQGNYTKALEYYHQSLKLYEEHDNKKGISKLCNNIGNINMLQSNYPKALEYYQKSLIIKKTLGDKRGISKSYNNIGIIHNANGNYPKALEHYQKALNIYEEIGDKSGVAICFNNIGVIYELQKDYPTALKYHKKALNIREIMGDKGELSKSYNSVGTIYECQNNYNIALEYYQKSLEIRKFLGDKSGLSISYNQIGTIYGVQNNFSKAFEYLQKALKLSIEIGSKSKEANNYIELGILHLKQNKLNEAYNYAKKAYKTANKTGETEFIKRSYELLANCSSRLGLYKEAYRYHTAFKALSDSLFNENNIKRITGLEYQYKYEKEKHKTELEQQKKDTIRAEERRWQETIRNSFITAFILMSLLVIVILLSFFQKRKANKILISKKNEIQNQAKELKVKNSELSKLNATKDKFFSIIAHDLRAPFNALLGFSNMLFNNYKSYNEERIEKYIGHINTSAINTNNLLEDLLTWSKSQTGRIDFSIVKIHIKTLVDNTFLLLTESAMNKDIKLISNIGNNLFMHADKDMISTTVRNLVSNAIKFTYPNGDIIVDAILIKGENRQDFIQLSVKDNGIGIDKDAQTKLFNISENTSTNGTEGETGTGLGLILCKEFINKHNCKIWVESELGEGSTFYFKISS